MNTCRPFVAVWIALAMAGTAVASGRGQDSDRKSPGAEEAAEVERANVVIDSVYGKLMSKLDPEQQKNLREAQRAWIKWRDAEADFIARLGGAVGGSAFRVDYSSAQAKLIQQRTEVLRGYLRDAASDR